MNIKDIINQLYTCSDNEESASCPVLLFKNNKIQVGIFTFFITNEDPTNIIGYGRLIKSNGKKIGIEDLSDKFTDKEIVINDDEPMSITQLVSLYAQYYDELQKYVDGQGNIKELSDAFKAIVTNDTIEMYRPICPEFIEIMKNN